MLQRNPEVVPDTEESLILGTIELPSELGMYLVDQVRSSEQSDDGIIAFSSQPPCQYTDRPGMT
jgi:hypothetical protein